MPKVDRKRKRILKASVNVWRAAVAVKAKSPRNERISLGATPAPKTICQQPQTSGSCLQWLLMYEAFFTSPSTFFSSRGEPEQSSASWKLTRPWARLLDVSEEPILSRTTQWEEWNPTEFSSVNMHRYSRKEGQECELRFKSLFIIVVHPCDPISPLINQEGFCASVVDAITGCWTQRTPLTDFQIGFSNTSEIVWLLGHQ